MTDTFRVSYSKLWMSLINADLDGIKKYATELNCGDMYGLFACMITARSWTAINSGIDKSQMSESEVSALHMVLYIITYIKFIIKNIFVNKID